MNPAVAELVAKIKMPNPENPSRTSMLRYGCAVVSTAIATWVRVLLGPVIGDRSPFLTLLFAVLVTAWYGGVRPALVAVIGGIFLADYFVVPPLGSFGFKGATQYVDLCLYFCLGVGIAVIGGLMHAARLSRIRRLQLTEVALTQAQERVLLTVRSSGIAVWTWNIPSNSVEADENCAVLFGLPIGRFPQTVEGFAALVHPDDRQQVQEEVAASVEHGAEYKTEFRVLCPEGTIRSLATRGKVYNGEGGRPLRLTGVTWDVSERRQAEESLRATADELAVTAVRAEAATKTKSEFLATMSHEIRTPMNGVIGMTGLLLETALSAEQRELAEAIRGSGESLLCVINDILDFSKIEAGKLDLETHAFDLRSLLEESLELVAGMAHSKQLELCALVEDDVPPCVAGDPARLRQILLNLLGNAIKFTEAGEVVLSARQEAQGGDTCRIRFAVQDTGIGIAEETKGILFQRFSQADSSTTRRYGGTGLGLAISKRLVNLMGGEIGVDSTMGSGSSFWFTVPLKKAASVPVPASLDSLRGKRVLVVDDNRTNRSILKKQIGNAGMNVTVAALGAEAIALLEDAAGRGMPFDLGVLDLHMPLMNGLMLTREIRSREALSGLHLLMLTSDRDREEAAAAREMGVASFLVKPVRQAALFKAVAQTLIDVRRIEPPAPALERSRLRGRVLVADDNPTNQKVIVMRLKRLGCDVDVANDGLEAVKSASSRAYDLILMDCQMPVMDGFQATRAIRQHSARHVPIVALTANAMEGERERCLDTGMDDYLAKPVRPETLVAKLQHWLRVEPVSAPAPPAASQVVSPLRDQLDVFTEELKKAR